MSGKRQSKKAKKEQATRRTKRESRESTLPPGQAGKVLDRLLLLEQVISSEDVQQVLR